MDPLHAAREATIVRELDAVGLSRKAGWLASAWLYGTGSSLFLAVSILAPGPIGIGAIALSVAGYLLCVFSLIGARVLTNSDRAVHARLIAGVVTVLSGALLLGPVTSAFAFFVSFVLVTPAVLYGPRFVIPYATCSISSWFVVEMVTRGEKPVFAHAFVSAAMLWMLTVGFMVARSRSRELAFVNTRLAYTDALTGVANTRCLHERLGDELRAVVDAARSVTLFALDLDNFKRINDLYDHATGDRVLRAVADALEMTVGPLDLVARRGGDEFSVLLPVASDSNPDGLSIEIAEAIRRARLRICPEVSPSASVAYVRSRPEDTIATLLRRADDVLHDTKAEFHAVNGPARTADNDPRRLAAADGSGHDPTVTRIPAGDSQTAHEAGDAAPALSAQADPAWPMAAAIFASIGLVIGSMALPGLLAPLAPWEGGLTALGFLALALACAIAYKVAARVDWLHVALLGAIALLTWCIAASGSSGAAIIDLLAVIGLFAFFYFKPAIAGIHAVICYALYVGFTLGVPYAYPITRPVVTGVCIAAVMAIVIKVRAVTNRFARLNHELSEVDALTGLANVRALRERLADAIQSRRKTPKPLTIFALDLDQFKPVNDTYCHSVGDQVLADVARAIRETVRGEDLVARRGGDEFFVLCDSLEESEAVALHERLVEAIKHARKRKCPDLVAGVSIGRVSWSSGQGVDEFMDSADRALHEAKLRTKNVRPHADGRLMLPATHS